MRTIDSDDFLKQSTELYEHAGWNEREVHFSLADLRCNLEMMPTTIAGSDWIPFSEREPDSGAHVLITVEYGADDLEVMEMDWGVLKHLVNHEGGNATPMERIIYHYATAWMPLPPPYKSKETTDD